MSAWVDDRQSRLISSSLLLLVSTLVQVSRISSGIKAAPLSAKPPRAIDYLHEQAGHSSPTESEFVQEVLDGIRVLGGLMEEPPRNVKMSEQLQPSLEKMIRHMPDTLLGHRDRALITQCRSGITLAT